MKVIDMPGTGLGEGFVRRLITRVDQRAGTTATATEARPAESRGLQVWSVACGVGCGYRAADH
jgi:hypothetical protein